MLPLLTHTFILQIVVQTPGLVTCDNTIQIFLYHSLSYHSRFPCESCSGCRLNSLAPTLQKPSDTPELGDDVMHTVQADTKLFNDTLKHYTTITLHHMIRFGTCVWVWVDNQGVPGALCCSYPL